MTRKQSFFGRLVAAFDLGVLLAGYVVAYFVRLRLWQIGYPLLPIGNIRASAWIVTILFPAWLIALRYFNLYNPAIYRSTSKVLMATCKAHLLGSILMLNTAFIIRGFDGVSRPLLALVIMFGFVGLIAEKAGLLLVMRYRWRLQRRASVWRVLLVGNQEDARTYLEMVREHPEWNLRVVDVIAASPNGAAVRSGNGDLHSTTER